MSDKKYVVSKEDEALQKSMDILKCGVEQHKLMIPNRSALKKFEKVKEDLKYLLEQTGFVYTLNTERSDLFPDCIVITAKLDAFNVCSRDYTIFKEIVNLVDDISITPLNDISVEVSFSIHDMYFDGLKKRFKKDK